MLHLLLIHNLIKFGGFDLREAWLFAVREHSAQLQVSFVELTYIGSRKSCSFKHLIATIHLEANCGAFVARLLQDGAFSELGQIPTVIKVRQIELL